MLAFRTRIADLHGVDKTRNVSGHSTTRDAVHPESGGAAQLRSAEALVDVILYQGNQITLYYDENTWDFTRLARIEDVTKEEMLSVLGNGDVAVKLWIEWSE